MFRPAGEASDFLTDFPTANLKELELVEGNEASGPAGPTGEESFDCAAKEAGARLVVSYIRSRLHLGVIFPSS